MGIFNFKSQWPITPQSIYSNWFTSVLLYKSAHVSIPLPSLDIFVNMGENHLNSQTTCKFKHLFTYSLQVCISSVNFLDISSPHFPKGWFLLIYFTLAKIQQVKMAQVEADEIWSLTQKGISWWSMRDPAVRELRNSSELFVGLGSL